MPQSDKPVTGIEVFHGRNPGEPWKVAIGITENGHYFKSQTGILSVYQMDPEAAIIIANSLLVEAQKAQAQNKAAHIEVVRMFQVLKGDDEGDGKPTADLRLVREDNDLPESS